MIVRVRRRRGFTILDLAIAGILMTVVALVLARAWDAFGRSARLAVARARLAQEANLAAEAIARDVGRLARPGGASPAPPWPNVRAGDSTLRLWVVDGEGQIRQVIYKKDADDPGNLTRYECDAEEAGDSLPPGSGRVVATLVSDFKARDAAVPSNPGVPGVEIELTLGHRVIDRDPDGASRGDYTRRYLLLIEGDPS